MEIFWFVVALIVSCVIGYLLGSINFAIIITKIVTGKDIRESGSGNAGFTNTLRTVGKIPSIFVLLGDFLKGVVSALIGLGAVSLLTSDSQLVRFGAYVATIGAIVGHMFPLYYKFKGGKGILVTAGTLVILDPITLLIILGVFLIVVAFTRIVSISSISAAVAFPITTISLRLIQNGDYIIWDGILSVVIAIVIIAMHRENIKRLLNGTEKRFGEKKQ